MYLSAANSTDGEYQHQDPVFDADRLGVPQVSRVEKYTIYQDSIVFYCLLFVLFVLCFIQMAE